MSHSSLISRKRASTTEVREARIRDYQRRVDCFDENTRRFLHSRLTNEQVYTQKVGRKCLSNQYDKMRESIGSIAGMDSPNIEYVSMSVNMDQLFFHNTRKQALGVRYKNITEPHFKRNNELNFHIHAYLRSQDDRSKSSFLLFADTVMAKEEIVATYNEDTQHWKTLEDTIFRNIISVPDFEPKTVLLQLTEGAEFLNQMGVSHRYIRVNSVFINLYSKNVKIAFFDYACVFWCVETKTSIQQSKGIPTELHITELDHLPPECFQDHYDSTHVDCWSIGVIGCLLLSSTHPFNPLAPDKMTCDWLEWSERTSFPEEMRTLLDDIFQSSTTRIPLFEMQKDRRLTLSHKRAILEPLESFVRVESFLSLHRIASNSSTGSIAALNGEIDWSTFSPDIEEMFNHNGLKTVETLENCKIKYEKDQIYESTSPSPSLLANYEDKIVEVKIIMLKKVPLRQAQLLTLETHRILSFMSKRPDIPSSFQKVIQILKVKEQTLYVFIYEPLGSKLCLHELALKNKISARNMKWMIKQLVDLIIHFEKFGVAHRYITPENIFLVTNSQIKLKASEMACFTINPKKRKRTARKRGLQDEQQAFWKHLPPDCFNTLYDASKVDIWSIAVVQVFCLTGGTWPFEKKMLLEGLDSCKTHYQQHIRTMPDLIRIVDILDKCFVDQTERISPKKLDLIIRGLPSSSGL